MTKTPDLSFREKNDRDNAKIHSSFEQAVKEAGLFTSGKLRVNRGFNRKHILSAFYTFPSPPPFIMDNDVATSIENRALEIRMKNENKHLSRVMRLFFKVGDFLSSKIPMRIGAEFIPLTSIVEEIGLPNDLPLSRHSQQIRKWIFIALPVYLFMQPVSIFFTFFLIFITSVWSLSLVTQTVSPVVEQVLMTISVISILIYSVGLILIPPKLLGRIWTKNFYESICVREIIYLLFELKNDQAISDIGIRRNIQYRLNRLAYYTLALGKRFSSLDKSNQKWLENHFSQMAAYILERERWLLAPMPNTLEDLRKNFRNLVGIYISGNYGLFEWDLSVAQQSKPESRWLRLLKALGRLIFYFLPVGLLIWSLVDTTILSSFNIQPSTIIFLLIAWILLGMDSVLKLGVVSDILVVAKGLRDLS